jgi:RNA polymerase sigma factor (sigma-70 family)
MTVHQQRPAPRPCQPRPAWIDTCQVLTPEQLEKLWAAYLVNRADQRLRNRLVEHYAPWIREHAASIARKMRLRDEDNAVGEALAALVEYIVPEYDGHSGFDRWVRVCVKRRLIDQRRLERATEFTVASDLSGHDGRSALERLPGRPDGNLDFPELTVDLTDRQAAVLWMRCCRGMSIQEIAEILHMSETAVASITFVARESLKKKSFETDADEFSTYL